MFLPGAIYHVNFRVARGEFVFGDDFECIEFIETLRTVRDLDDWTIFAWCLAPSRVPPLTYNVVYGTQRNLTRRSQLTGRDEMVTTRLKSVNAGRSMTRNLLAAALMLVGAGSSPSVGTECLDPIGGWPYGPSTAVAVAGDHVFFGHGPALVIADAYRPSNLRIVSSLGFPNLVRGIAVRGRYAHVVGDVIVLSGRYHRPGRPL